MSVVSDEVKSYSQNCKYTLHNLPSILSQFLSFFTSYYTPEHIYIEVCQGGFNVISIPSLMSPSDNLTCLFYALIAHCCFIFLCLSCTLGSFNFRIFYFPIFILWPVFSNSSNRLLLLYNQN